MFLDFSLSNSVAEKPELSPSLKPLGGEASGKGLKSLDPRLLEEYVDEDEGLPGVQFWPAAIC